MLAPLKFGLSGAMQNNNSAVLSAGKAKSKANGTVSGKKNVAVLPVTCSKNAGAGTCKLAKLISDRLLGRLYGEQLNLIKRNDISIKFELIKSLEILSG